jgi:hypothetical protein
MEPLNTTLLLMVVVPVYVLAPPRVNVPAPLVVRRAGAVCEDRRINRQDVIGSICPNDEFRPRRCLNSIAAANRRASCDVSCLENAVHRDDGPGVEGQGVVTAILQCGKGGGVLGCNVPREFLVR